MSIKKVWIKEGCIVCGLCADTCFEVFKMQETTAVVNEGIEYNDYEELIREAAENCPVGIICYE